MRHLTTPFHSFKLDITEPNPRLSLPLGQTYLATGIYIFAILYFLVPLMQNFYLFLHTPLDLLLPFLISLTIYGIILLFLFDGFLPRGHILFKPDGIKLKTINLTGIKNSSIPVSEFKGMSWKNTHSIAHAGRTIYLLHEDQKKSIPVFQTRFKEWKNNFLDYTKYFNMEAALRTPNGIVTLSPEQAGTPLQDLARQGILEPKQTQAETLQKKIPMPSYIIPSAVLILLYLALLASLLLTLYVPGAKHLLNILILPILLVAIICAFWLFDQYRNPNTLDIEENQIHLTKKGRIKETIDYKDIILIEDDTMKYGPLKQGFITILTENKSITLNLPIAKVKQTYQELYNNTVSVASLPHQSKCPTFT